MELLEPWKSDTEVPTASRIANALVFSDVCKPHTEIYPRIGLTDQLPYATFLVPLAWA